jgi:hypothetical protein
MLSFQFRGRDSKLMEKPHEEILCRKKQTCAGLNKCEPVDLTHKGNEPVGLTHRPQLTKEKK